MEFGIFFELSTPSPGPPGIDRVVIEHALEQARLADELGFDVVWAVEHHFLEEYSHCSAPEVLLAAIAAQTPARAGGPRRGDLRARHQPPGAGGRTGRHARHHLGRPPRAGDGPVVDVDRARRLRRRSRHHQEGVGRVRAGAAEDVGRRAVRARRRGLLHARAQRDPQARPATPSADVGHGDEPGHRARRRRPRARLPRGRLRRLRRAGAPHHGVPPPDPAVRPGGRRATRRSRRSTSSTATRTPGTRGGRACAWSTSSASPTPTCCRRARRTRPGRTSTTPCCTWSRRWSTPASPGAGPAVPEGTVVGDPAHVLAAVRHWESIGVDQVNVIVERARGDPPAARCSTACGCSPPRSCRRSGRPRPGPPRPRRSRAA